MIDNIDWRRYCSVITQSLTGWWKAHELSPLWDCSHIRCIILTLRNFMEIDKVWCISITCPYVLCTWCKYITGGWGTDAVLAINSDISYCFDCNEITCNAVRLDFRCVIKFNISCSFSNMLALGLQCKISVDKLNDRPLRFVCTFGSDSI